MISYQDYLKVGDGDKERMEFIRKVITEHTGSDLYRNAEDAENYYTRQNTTITKYQKLLYDMSGTAVPDNFSANYKICSGFFQRFVIQQVQYLLGNGVSWKEEKTGDRLGDKFDGQLQKIARSALVGAVAFGFWNYDHVDVFKITEFAPIFDEEDGSIKCGVRFWQIDATKPLRATFYELDGYTEYIWRKESEKEIGEVLKEKRKYVLKARKMPSGDVEIIDGYNYPSFPIVPLWANESHIGELSGLRSGIDAYDLIKSGFANDLDDASQIYWTIQNAGGMDDVDLAQFIKHMKTVKAAVVEDTGARAESHTLEVPYASREALLERLRVDLYEDAMALDLKNIAGGAVTATQIKAAYEPLNEKTDMFEYQVISFVQAILELAGIDDEPTFTRSIIVNQQEMIQVLAQSAQYLSGDYITEKILTLLGDGDRIDEILRDIDGEDIDRFGGEDGLRTRTDRQGTEETGEEDNEGVRESVQGSQAES